MNRVLPAAACVLGYLCGLSVAQTPMGTTFTYQGELRSAGAPATGLHDLRFTLYDGVLGGTQVGATLCADNVSLSEGRFTASLDFGAVFAGQERFLEIQVRADTGLDCTDPTGFVTLAPRQPLSGAPNALFALGAQSAAYATAAGSATTATTATTATNATQLNGQAASFYQNAANLTSGTLPSARLSGTYSGAVNFSNASNAITGSGAGLTGLSASNIGVGTLADGRLSTNVALLAGTQTFLGAKTFSAAPVFAAGGSPFSVSGSGLVANLNADLFDGFHSSAFLQSVPYPLLLSGANTGYIFRAENSSSVNGASAVQGVCTTAAGITYGGRFESASPTGYGVLAWATAATGVSYGVYGLSSSPDGYGVYGWTNAASGANAGVYGRSGSPDGRGVFGWASASGGNAYGVYGRSESTTGTGIYGAAIAGTGATRGVYGESASTTGRGVFGTVSAGSGVTYGVYGTSGSVSGTGVYGWATASTGSTYGVSGQNDSTSGIGVRGLALASTGTTYGGNFQSASASGTGVQGVAQATTGTTYGGYFQSDSTSGHGVYGKASATSGGTRGVEGVTASTGGTAVFGDATATTGFAYGMFGQSNSTSGRGISGWALAATGSTMGVEGFANSSGGYGVYGAIGGGSGWGVYASGQLGASGTKSFRIDHPDDPENKYLLHYSSESPEVINFYRGNVVLDGSGEAVVELPAYFAKLNKDPSYVLTAVGVPMPMLHVAQEIDESALSAGARAEPDQAAPMCSFRIAGGEPGAKVSWEVKAVRNDRYVQRHGAPVEVVKQGAEKGTYQHPELYGQPAVKSMNNNPERAKGFERPETGPTAARD